MAYKFAEASILVVDDMKPMLTLIVSLLCTFGFKDVYTASSGNAGFEEFRKRNPDIVLTDWLMEDGDGLSLCKKIRESSNSPNKFVPVVMMTGFSHRNRVVQARDSGITEFLVKPFTARGLYNRLERLIEYPRKFVELDEFFGPDRRRKKLGTYNGPFRRDEDIPDLDMVESDEVEDNPVLDFLRDLTDEVKDKVEK